MSLGGSGDRAVGRKSDEEIIIVSTINSPYPSYSEFDLGADIENIQSKSGKVTFLYLSLITVKGPYHFYVDCSSSFKTDVDVAE